MDLGALHQEVWVSACFTSFTSLPKYDHNTAKPKVNLYLHLTEDTC